MALDSIDQENLRREQIARFSRNQAIIVTVIVAVPTLIGWIITPPGSVYFGIQTNLDDHMVYAAWMRQAMEGRFLFDNRFTTDPQPGLTVNLYFFVLGLLAKLVTIPVAMFVARLAFTFLFVHAFGRLLTKLKLSTFSAKFALLIGCFGGGLGFAVWERFGQEIVNGPEALKPLLLGRLPIDVWQPEAFVFPSALTNGLFMFSLCLIVWTLGAVIEAKDHWKPVLPGALAFGVLANVHSYDTVLVGLVLIGYLVAQLKTGQATPLWVGRAACIAAGAVPAAVWLGYVLSKDPVFQARAATLTYSPNFRQVLFGIFPAVVLACVAAWKSVGKTRTAAFGTVVLLLAALTALSAGHDPSVGFLNWGAWCVLTVFTLGALWLLAKEDDAWNLAWSWALLGLCALYLPVLFQRKLAMGMILPWAILAAYGLVSILKPLERSTRNLVATLTLCLMCGSSILWFKREKDFIDLNVGSTTVHSVYFSKDSGQILNVLNSIKGRTVVLAMPGVWNPVGPADFRTPLVPDFNPILSGMTGVYTYAGHWSETPDYGKRRGLSTLVYLAATPDDKRKLILDEIRPDYVVAPNTKAFPTIGLGAENVALADLTTLGKVVYSGNQLLLIQIAR
ncbi:MAG: hypothetical protein JST30_11105 [Armatimonadetes bacterium]|nr:hypothetical protein [Armatimonadota bacterium]